MFRKGLVKLIIIEIGSCCMLGQLTWMWFVVVLIKPMEYHGGNTIEPSKITIINSEQYSNSDNINKEQDNGTENIYEIRFNKG